MGFLPLSHKDAGGGGGRRRDVDRVAVSGRGLPA